MASISYAYDNHPPVANPDGPGSSDPDVGCGDSIVSYQWVINNNASLTYYGSYPTVPWSDLSSLPLGTSIPVKLTVYDEFGASGSSTTTLTINDILICGDTITNDTVLIGDLSNCPGDGIIIGASNITLDCAGHIIDGVSSALSSGVRLNGNNVTIKNCITTQFVRGVYIEGSDNQVINSTAYGNSRGIEIHTTYSWIPSSNNKIINSTFSSNSNSGIDISGKYNQVINSVANSNSNGIYLYGTDNMYNQFINSTFDNNWYGIYLQGGTSNNQFINSTSNNNIRYGIYFDHSSNNVFSNVRATGDWYDYYSDAYSKNKAINLKLATANVSFEAFGVWLNKTTNKPADTPGLKNINKYVDVGNTAATGWIFMNVSYTNGDVGTGNETTLKWYRWNGTTWTDSEIDPNGVNTGDNYVYGNATSFSTFAPMAKIIINCGDTITENTTLTQDLLNCPGNGLTIGANNIVLDCNGHSITGMGSGDGIYLFQKTGVTIKNCNISSFFYAIDLAQSSYNNIINTSASGGYYGILFLSSTRYNNIINSSATSSEAGYSAIELDSGANYNQIINTNANGDTAIDFYLSHYNNVTNTNANGGSYGIHLRSSSNNNITNTTGTGDRGIGLDSSSGNHITSSVGMGGAYGIYLSSASNNQIISSRGSGMYGFWLDGASNNQIINSNTSNFESSFYDSGNIIINMTFIGTAWPTKASFTYSGFIDVSSANAIADSAGLGNISKYLSITNESLANVLLNIHYSDSDLGSLDENYLRMYKHDGTDWILVSGSGVDTANNVVYANITDFSVFAPMVTECLSNSDCDDSNECTQNICNATYQCEYSYESQGTQCGLARDCPDDYCSLFKGYFYPDDGHDTCDGSGNCLEYSCGLEDSYCTDNDPLDGINSLECGAQCDSNDDCSINSFCQDDCTCTEPLPLILTLSPDPIWAEKTVKATISCSVNCNGKTAYVGRGEKKVTVCYTSCSQSGCSCTFTAPKLSTSPSLETYYARIDLDGNKIYNETETASDNLTVYCKATGESCSSTETCCAGAYCISGTCKYPSGPGGPGARPK